MSSAEDKEHKKVDNNYKKHLEKLQNQQEFRKIRLDEKAMELMTGVSEAQKTLNLKNNINSLEDMLTNLSDDDSFRREIVVKKRRLERELLDSM